MSRVDTVAFKTSRSSKETAPKSSKETAARAHQARAHQDRTEHSHLTIPLKTCSESQDFLSFNRAPRRAETTLLESGDKITTKDLIRDEER